MEEIKSLTGKTLQGFIWKFLEKTGAQIIQLIIQIVLARLLLPKEYGLVGLLAIFITISDVFILQGFTTALIQKKDVDDLDFSSVFYANILLSFSLYIILYITAPLVANFYNENKLVEIMRVLSLNVIIGAFPAVHNVVLSRDLDFKKSFFRNIANVITQGIVGISMAYLGFGVWSMVFSKIFGSFVGAIVLIVTINWRPKLLFSFKRLIILFRYSSKVLITNLLNTIFNNIQSLIIGKYYTPTDVGYYQRGQQIPQTFMGALDGSMTEVLYPSFSKCQEDVIILKNSVRKSINLSMYIVCPILIGMIVVAEPLTLLLLTEKWLPSVPIMQLTCVSCLFWPLAHRNHALNALGKSNVTLKISVIGKIITLICIFYFLRFGIYAMLFSTIAASFLSLLVSSFFIKKYLNYSITELIKDIIPSLILAIIMGAIVYFVGMLINNLFLKLLIEVLVGLIIYWLLSYLCKLQPYSYIIKTIKKVLKRSSENEFI